MRLKSHLLNGPENGVRTNALVDPKLGFPRTITGMA